MPKVPRIIGDLMDFMFSKVNVCSVESASPAIKIITFKGVFPKVNFKIGQALIMRVDSSNYRNYTPCHWDSASGLFTVIFHLHGHGPGSDFISRLRPGDPVSIGLPRGFNIYRKESSHHFFFGDETCLSVFKSLGEAIHMDQHTYTGILEADTDQLPESIDLTLDIVPKSVRKAEYAIERLDKMNAAEWAIWQDGSFYLMGNARSILAFRKHLKEKGVPGKNIYTQPFWVEGKTGL